MNETVKLDSIDKKIIYCLSVNARFSNTTIAKELKISRELTAYRINRLIKNGIINSFTTYIYWPAIGVTSSPNFYLKLNMIPMNKKEEIIKKLTEQDDIISIAECEGKYNLHIRALYKDKKHFRLIIDNIKSICGQYLSDFQIIEICSDNFSNTPFLTSKGEIKTIKYHKDGSYQKDFEETYRIRGGFKNDHELGKYDLEIIHCLAEDCRQPLESISDQIKVPVTTIKYRIKKMIRDKLIYRFRPRLDYDKMGYKSFSILVKLSGYSDDQLKAISALKAYHANTYIGLCLSDWDFLVSFHVKDQAEIKGILDKILIDYPNAISNYETIWITKWHKAISMPKDLAKFRDTIYSSNLIDLLGK